MTGAAKGQAGVSQIRFYNTSDGWAFGPQLWATHNGGRSWKRIGTGGLRVTALETAGQRVFAVWAPCSGTGASWAAGCTGQTLQEAAPGSNRWAPVPGAATGLSGSGTASAAALVLTGSRGYLLPPTGVLVSGPVSGAGGWQPVTGSAAPCLPGAARARRPAGRCAARRDHHQRAGPGLPGRRRQPRRLHLRRRRADLAEGRHRACRGHRHLGGGRQHRDDRAGHHRGYRAVQGRRGDLDRGPGRALRGRVQLRGVTTPDRASPSGRCLGARRVVQLRRWRDLAGIADQLIYLTPVPRDSPQPGAPPRRPAVVIIAALASIPTPLT